MINNLVINRVGGPDIQEGWVELKICRYFICKLSGKFLKLSSMWCNVTSNVFLNIYRDVILEI